MAVKARYKAQGYVFLSISHLPTGNQGWIWGLSSLASSQMVTKDRRGQP